jgi:hypothetical protein
MVELDRVKLLLMMISAGADVYAKHYQGRTATVTAKKRGKLSAWVQALVFCGFDVEEVFAASEHNYTIGTQTSKFSFDQIRTMMLQNTVLEETLGEIAATYPDDRNSGVTDNHCGNGGCTVCLKSCGSVCGSPYQTKQESQNLKTSDSPLQPHETQMWDEQSDICEASPLESREPSPPPLQSHETQLWEEQSNIYEASPLGLKQPSPVLNFYPTDTLDDPLYEAGFHHGIADPYTHQSTLEDERLESGSVILTGNSLGWVT